MDRLDNSYFKINEIPYIDQSVSLPELPGQQNVKKDEKVPDLNFADINMLLEQDDIIGSADKKIVDLQEAIHAYANEFCLSNGTTLKEVLLVDSHRNKYVTVKDAYIEYYGQGVSEETDISLATQYATNPSGDSLDAKVTMGGEVENQLFWAVYASFQAPLQLRTPAPLPPSALVYYHTNLTIDLQGVKNEEKVSSFINFAAQASVTIPPNHSLKAELKMKKQNIIQNFFNVIHLTGSFAIVPHEPIEGKDIWFQPIAKVAPYMPPRLVTVENGDLIFKGLGVFKGSLNMYPYYHFTLSNIGDKQVVEEYDYFSIVLEADKPLLLAAL